MLREESRLESTDFIDYMIPLATGANNKDESRRGLAEEVPEERPEVAFGDPLKELLVRQEEILKRDR